MRSYPLIATLFVAGIAIAGCSGSSQDEQPSPSPEAPEAPEALPSSVLLPAQDMPVWNGAIVWQVDDSADGVDVFDACEVPTLQSLGASEVVQQDYEDPAVDSIEGTNAVGLFPDAMAAAEALKSLSAAMSTCGAVPVTDPSNGNTWTKSQPQGGDESEFDFIGFGAVGDRVTIVGFTLEGQDANYEGDVLIDALNASLDRL